MQAKVSLIADVAGFKRRLQEAGAAFKQFQRIVSAQTGNSFVGPMPLTSGGSPRGIAGGAGGNLAGNSGGGMGGSLLSMGMKGAAAVGVTVGAAALYQRRLDIARQNMSIRSLTGGSTVGGISSQGFTGEEHRERAMGIATELGRNASEAELTRLTDQSEKLQRRFGISQEQSSATVGAGRRAGAQGEKVLATAIGAAVTSGLTGSRVGEFLASMTESLTQMSQGVNIDTSSLAGMASSLAGMSFFKDDPRRAFRTIQQMGGAFSNGDRYQQAQAARAIQMSSPGASAADIELRRSQGLFGETSAKDLDRMKRLGYDDSTIKTLGLKGPELIGNIFKDVMATGSGMGMGEKQLQFQQKTGIQDFGAAQSLFLRIQEAERKGEAFKLTKFDRKKLQEAGQSPEVLVMKNLDGSILNLNTSVQNLTDRMSNVAGEGAVGAKGVWDTASGWLGKVNSGNLTDQVGGNNGGFLSYGGKSGPPSGDDLAGTPEMFAAAFAKELVEALKENTTATRNNSKTTKGGIPGNATVMDRRREVTGK